MDWRKRNTTARLSACMTLMLVAGCAGVVGHKHGERPDCVCFPRGACAGYYSTCWRLWPEECATCPVSGGPVVPGGPLLTPGPFTAPGEPAMPANGAGPGELISPPEPPKIRAPLSPPDSAGSRSAPAATAPSNVASALASTHAQPVVASDRTAPGAGPKPAVKSNAPSRPVIKSFTVPAKDVAVAPTRSAAPAPVNSIAASTKRIRLAPATRLALDAPAMPAAWEERIAAKSAAPRPAAASRPIVAAALRRQRTVDAPYVTSDLDASAARVERLPSEPAPMPSATRPIVSTPPRQTRVGGFDERRVVTTRPQASPVEIARPPLNRPSSAAATRQAASSALAELWSGNAPGQHRGYAEPDERTDLRIVSEVKPLPPVQPAPVVHSVEMRHDSIVVRDDRIEKLPSIETQPPARAPARLADNPPVVRPALRR